MLEDMAFEIKEAIQKAQEDQSPAYIMIITKKTAKYPKKSLNYFAARPWKGTYVKTLVGNTAEDFFEETDIEGLFYQLIDNRKSQVVKTITKQKMTGLWMIKGIF